MCFFLERYYWIWTTVKDLRFCLLWWKHLILTLSITCDLRAGFSKFAWIAQGRSIATIWSIKFKRFLKINSITSKTILSKVDSKESGKSPASSLSASGVGSLPKKHWASTLWLPGCPPGSQRWSHANWKCISIGKTQCWRCRSLSSTKT